jgi:hypothetical protein
MTSFNSASGAAVRNGSEFPVPNGSKSSVGRPAVATDEQLLDLATRLNQQLGRPPRADELITEAGGCQRKRALAAIRTLKLDLASRAVQSILMFPPSIESGLRALYASWLQQAGAQLAAKHLEEQERLDVRAQAQQALIEEQQAAIATLKQQVGDRERMTNELRRRIGDLEVDLGSARDEVLRLTTVAEERLRLLDRFESRPAEVVTSPSLASAAQVPA